MDKDPFGRVVLMSIQPEYAEAILRGEKLVEFRKRPVADDVTHVIVYATMPVGAIVGAFTVAGQETSSPMNLWKEFGQGAGIGWGEFFDYYQSHAEGTCIRVGDILICDHYVNLNQAFGISRPPQSFQYVDAECARQLMETMQPASNSSLPVEFA